MNLSNILAPVDFSGHARPAAFHALNLANHFDGKVSFLHVVEPIPFTLAPFEAGFATAAAMPSPRELEKSLGKALEAFLEDLPAGGRAEKVLRPGDAAGCIEDEARKRNVDLIVMPTRGYGPFRRLVLGSVTTKVLNDASCPVFTGAHVETIPPHDPRPYRRIGVVIDLQNEHKHVLRWAADFAASYEGKLYVIYGAPTAEMATPGAQIPAEIRTRLVEDAQGKIAARLRRMAIDAEVYVASSASPDRMVSDVVEAKNLDLLIIGRPPSDSLLGRLTSDTYDIVRRSPCPVVSV